MRFGFAALYRLTCLLVVSTALSPQVAPQPSDKLEMRECKAPARGKQRVGPLPFGLHFDVPTEKANLEKGSSDVDYTVQIVRPKKGTAHLELWFGPYAMGEKANPDDLARSSNVVKREVTIVGTDQDGHVGSDIRGSFPDGRVWRHTSFGGSGAEYRNASVEEAELFDAIIESACYIPAHSR